MPIINEQTLLPLGMFITGIIGAITAGVAYGKGHYKLGGMETRVEKLESRVDTLEKEALPNAERLVRVETQLENILDLLQHIQQDLQRK